MVNQFGQETDNRRRCRLRVRQPSTRLQSPDGGRWPQIVSGQPNRQKNVHERCDGVKKK